MKYLNKFYDYIVYSVILISFCMLFLPCGMFKNGFYQSESSYNGFQLFLANKTDIFQLWKFNIFGLLMIILIVMGVLLSILKNKVKYGQYISSVLLLLGSISYFLIGISVRFVQIEVKKDFILLFPFYLGFVLCFLSSLLLMFKKQILKKLN